MSHALLRTLESGDASERAAACSDCVDDPSAVLLLEALAAALGDPEKAVARAASDALVALSDRHAEVHEVLRSAQRGEAPRTRWGAVFTSSRIRPPQPGMLPTLVEAMASRDGDVRWSAARITVDLARLHDEAFRAVLQLVEAGSSPALRRMAVFCLRDLAPDDPGAAQVLLRASRDPDLHLRRAALTAIGALASPLPEVAARLFEVVEGDADLASRRVAALALGQLGAGSSDALPQDAAARLSNIGSNTADPDLARAIEIALAKLGA